MSIEVILDVEGWDNEMYNWMMLQGCEPVEIKKFGSEYKSLKLNNCKPFHFYQNGNRCIRMFFWRQDKHVALLFMMRFPGVVFYHNMETTFEATGS